MKINLRFAVLLLAWSGLTAAKALAQTCNQTSPLVYRQAGSTNTTDVEKRTATETVNGTSFTYGGYTSTANGNTTNDIFQLTTDQQDVNLDARMLVWRQNNTGTPGTNNAEVDLTSPYAAQVTLTFTREVSNLSFVVQDIDKSVGGNGGSNFTDELAVYALNGAGTRVDLTNANIGYGAAGTATSSTINTFIDNITIGGVTQDAVRGVTLNGGVGDNPSRAGNVTFNFPSPVKTVRLTLRNLSSRSDVAVNGVPLRLQTIGIEQITWCAQADVATTLAGPATAAPGSTVTYVATIANNGDDAVISVRPTVQLPANLTGVTGGTYVASSGLLTLAAIPNLADGASTTRIITFTMPSAAVTGVVSVPTTGDGSTTAGSSAPDPVLANNNGSLANATVTTTPSYSISGTVFEDINYGGGLGRSIATANAVAANSAVGVGTAGSAATAATVELYNATTGAFIASTTTSTTAGSLGQYTFANLPGGTTYTTRVVNSTVRSTRTGSTAALLGVQTFNGATDRVGGEFPSRVDAAANTSANLSTLTPTTGTTAAQSLATVSVGTANVPNVDFGFNFDVVVNTNDAGQGSLRQFVANANALGGEGSLAQSGSRVNGAGATVALAAGVETSIFMIPDNAAHNGQRAGLGNALTNGTAIITTASTLTVTGTSTAIDGGTQTFNIGNTATGTVAGTSTTTVGIDGLAVAALNVPEVEISGSNVATVVDFEATNDILRGLAVHGGSTQTVLLGNTTSSAGYLIENTLVGVVAAGTRPTVASTISSSFGVYARASAGTGTVQNSFLAYTGSSGIDINNGTASTGTTQILGNQFLQNGYTSNVGDGITLGDGNGSGLVLVQGNLITNPNASGIQLETGSTSATQMLNNTIIGAGTGGASGSTSTIEGAGIGYLQRDGTRRGAAGDVISKNIITGSQAAGVVVGYGQQNVTISQNNTSGNGGLGIDLITNANYYVGSGNATGAADYGNGDGVSVNDGNDPAAAANTLPNRGVDFPVLTSAIVNGANLIVQGYSRPGAVIELFNPGTPDGTGFGEGQTYLGTYTEGSAADTDTGTGAYSGTINGLSQGSDAAARRFTFVIPLSGSYAGYAAGARLTGTATLNNSTSEFSGNVTVAAAPANCSASYYDNTNTYSGLSADYYQGYYNGNLSYFNTQTKTSDSGINSAIDFTRANGAGAGTFPITTATLPTATSTFSARYRGSFTITTAGSYTFSTTVDDQVQIWLDGNAIPATGAPQTTTFTPALASASLNAPSFGNASSAAIPLSAGRHNILIFYGAAGGQDNVNLKYAGPDSPTATVIPTAVLCAGPSNVPPTALAVTNPAIAGNSGPTTISSLNGTDFETSGSVTNYAIATLPANGTLRLGGVAVTVGQVITAAQAATLTFQPAPNFVGTTSFTFSAIDNAGQYSNTTATFTIPVNAADVATTITGPATLTGNVATANNAFTATFSNGGPAAAASVTRLITLPPGATMTPAQVTASGGTYTAPTSPTTSGTLNFGSLTSLASGGSSSFSFGLVPYNGGSSPVSTTSTISTTTAENGATANNTATLSSTVKFTPVPAYVTNASIASTGGSTAISALSATDQDGTVASYTITSIPAGSVGTLYYNNNADGSSGTYQPVTGTLTLTPAQAGSLRFDPTGASAGTVTFTYTATDNEGNPSTTASNGGTQVPGAAVFTIPLSNGGIAANNDSNTVPLNTPTPGNVLLNDYNPNNTGLAVALSGAATAGGTTTTYSGGTATTAHGTVTIAANGAYTYTPAPGYIGSDTFAYQVCSTSGTSTCATALVTLRVYDPGTACTSGTGPNLLTNSDFNQGNTGFTSDYTFVTKPNPLVVNTNGLYPDFTYAVDSNPQDYNLAFTGAGHTSASNPADKFMMLNGAPGAARIYSQTVTVQPNRYYTLSAFFNNLSNANKGVPEIGFVINGESASGTRMINEIPDRWVEVSDIWYSGSNTSATFEIRNVSTAVSGNDFGIDDVYFGTCNLAPIANNDLRTTPRNTSITFSATANDTDGDGAVVPGTFLFSNGTTSISVTGGTFTVDGSGNVTFAPTTGFTGTASTTYTVKDNATPTAATSNPGTISVTVGPPPVDLATAIAASAATVNAGATETLTITASNNGPTGTATNVTQTVQLPAGLTNVTFGTPTVGAGATLASGSASYNSTTGLVTFPAIASQATGTTGNVAYTVSFNAPANGPFTATANVGSADNSDTNPANNAASTTIAVSPRFDLATTLSGPTTAVQGTLATYTVTSANNGPSIAPNAVQTVTGLPTGLTQVFVSNGGTYNSTNGTVTFPAIASFANGQAVSNTISFVAPASGTIITPVATLTPNTSGGGETATANNTAGLNGVTNGATTTTAPATTDQANLNVATLTTSASSVAAGTAVTVNVTFKNNGPNTATSVFYQLSLTPGTVITSTLPVGANYNSTTGIVSFNGVGATLTSGATQSNTLTFTAPTAGPVMVAASVSSTVTADPVPADNYASTKVEILPSANVGTSIAGPATALAGQSVNYAVTTTNSGAAAAQNVVQTVELPGGLPVATLQLNGAIGTLSAGVITFTGGATYNVSTGMLTLPPLASAAAGSTTTNAITFVAPSGVASFSATAAVSSTTPDAVPANNTATATTTVTPSVDVRTLVSGPASVPVFNPLTLSVTTLNDGPSVAATVVPTLQLPANLTNVVLPTGAGYNSTTGLVTFATLSNLASGAAVTNSVSFTMPDVAQVTALGSSTVSGGAVDRNVDNNRVSFTTTSATPTDLVADLSATVTSSAGSVAAGSPVTLTLTIANGPASTSDAASNIRPVLALPAGLDVTTIRVGGQLGTYTSGTGVVTFPGGATYNVNTGQVVFPVVNTLLASDASGYAPLTYTVTLTAPGIDPLVATASVTSATSDPAPANNQQTLNVTVTPAADLVTSISGPTSAPATGGPVTYAVTTTNNGATPAASATTTVVLPIANGASYSVNGGATQTYNGTGVTLPVVASQQPGANGAVTNTISFTAPSGAPGSTFAVTATASTTTTETNTTNNGSSATTTRANQVPVAQSIVNSLQAPEGNTAAPLRISPLAATDADGTIATYQLTGSLPPASQGVLYYNNGADGTSGTYVALPLGQNLTQAQANTLRFDPAAGYAGNVNFTYTATDNLGGVSQAVLYTIPVGTDNNSVYTATPAKGGAAQYQTNDVLAFVIDPNGAAYNGSSLVYNPSGTTTTILAAGAANGLGNPGSALLVASGSGPAAAGSYPANPTNVLPAGVSLDPLTGLIYVSDRTQLVNNGTQRFYQVNVITTDIYGGTNVVLAQFIIGAYPLPVVLTAFTAQAVQNRDAQLSWTTASELNSAYFDVERSLDGLAFTKIGQVAAQGSSTTSQTYALTDANVAGRANGAVYYRLRQVDLDGTATFSPVRTVSFTRPAPVAVALSLYPNPAATSTTLELSGLPATGTYQVLVLDAVGRQVISTSRAGGLPQPLDLKDLASGTYQVLVTGTRPDGSPLRQALRLTKE